MDKNFINSETIDASGSSYLGGIVVSYKALVKRFGKPTFGFSGDLKCECEWCLKFSDGTIATIYDWKSNKKYCGRTNGIAKTKNICWHVGGFNKKAFELVKNELNIS